MTTNRFVSGTKICIPESQLDDYLRHHKREDLITHSDAIVGALPKRQWIIDKFGDVMMLDDDSIGMFRIYRRPGSLKRAVVSPDVAREVIERTADVTRQLGAFLFGFASHAHPRTFEGLRPFRFGGYSPGGAMGILSGSRLYFPTDPVIVRCGGDWWISLLNSYYHRYGFYEKRFAFGFKDTYRGSGGLLEFRKEGAEQEATAYLQKHFGDAVEDYSGKKPPTNVTKFERNVSKRRIKIPWKI